MRITPRQMEALSAVAVNDYSARLRQALIGLGGDVAREAGRRPAAWFSDWVSRATAWGVDDEGDLFEFTKLVMLAGEKWLEAPNSRAVLDDPELEGDLKVFQLRYLLRRGDV